MPYNIIRAYECIWFILGLPMVRGEKGDPVEAIRVRFCSEAQ